MEQLHLLFSDSYGLFSFQGTHPFGDNPSLSGHWGSLVALIKSASEQGFCDKSAGQRHFLGVLRGFSNRTPVRSKKGRILGSKKHAFFEAEIRA